MRFAIFLGFLMFVGCASTQEFIIDSPKDLKEFIESEKASGSKIVRIDTTNTGDGKMYRVLYKPNR